MAGRNVVTLMAKFVGGKQIEEEAKRAGAGVRGLGRDVKLAGEQAGNGKGWELFNKHVQRSERQAHTSSEKIKGFFGRGFQMLLGAGAAGAGIYGVKSLVDSTEELGRATMHLSSTSGMSYNSALQNSAALKAMGLNAEAGSKAFIFMSKAAEAGEKQERKFEEANKKGFFALEKKRFALAKAEAGGKAYAIQSARMALEQGTGNRELGKQAEGFRRLGISVAEWRKLKPDEQFSKIITGLSNMHNPAMRASTAMILLGRGGRELIPYLNSGSFSLTHMQEVAAKAFGVFGHGAKTIEDLRVKQAESSIAWEAMKFNIGMKLAPVLGKLMMAFSHIAVALREHTGIWGKLEGIVEGVVGVVKSIVEWFKHTHAAIEVLKPLIVGFVAAWVAWKAIGIYGTLVDIVAELIAMGPAVIIATGGFVLLAVAAYEIITHWRQVKEFFVGLWHGIEEGAVAVFNWFTKSTFGQIAMTVFLGPIPEIIKHWSGLVTFFEGLGTAIANAFKSVVNFGIIDPIDWLFRMAHKAYASVNIPGLPSWPLPEPMIPRLEHGGTIRHQGWALVGERGPEVMRFPTGARIDPLTGRGGNSPGLKGAFQAAPGSGDLHVHLEVDRREVATAVLREFRRLEART